MKPLVLASTSRSRWELLARFRVPFDAVDPGFDEIRTTNLAPAELALRNALGKARRVLPRFPGRVVIGSDQISILDGEVLGKPGSAQAAVEQLVRMSGRWVDFYTGVAVCRDDRAETAVEPYRVRLRSLSRVEIESYVRAENPVECAGSFRIEGRGIALMEELAGRDYTALIGLPLIALARLLDLFGIRVLLEPASAFRSSGMPF